MSGGTESGVDHRRLSSMLALPQDVSRLYRDDITISVLHFNLNYLRNHPAWDGKPLLTRFLRRCICSLHPPLSSWDDFQPSSVYIDRLLKNSCLKFTNHAGFGFYSSCTRLTVFGCWMSGGSQTIFSIFYPTDDMRVYDFVSLSYHLRQLKSNTRGKIHLFWLRNWKFISY